MIDVLSGIRPVEGSVASKPVTPEEAEGLGLMRMVLVKDKAHPLAATLNVEYVSAFRRQYLTKACLEAVMVCCGLVKSEEDSKDYVRKARRKARGLDPDAESDDDEIMLRDDRESYDAERPKLVMEWVGERQDVYHEEKAAKKEEEEEAARLKAEAEVVDPSGKEANVSEKELAKRMLGQKAEAEKKKLLHEQKLLQRSSDPTQHFTHSYTGPRPASKEEILGPEGVVELEARVKARREEMKAAQEAAREAAANVEPTPEWVNGVRQ
jgi:hypothetical protein